ncbi:hypothetical protein HQ535_04820 [bacterium]|nr:hypothetical protein [bacterium]
MADSTVTSQSSIDTASPAGTGSSRVPSIGAGTVEVVVGALVEVGEEVVMVDSGGSVTGVVTAPGEVMVVFCGF